MHPQYIILHLVCNQIFYFFYGLAGHINAVYRRPRKETVHIVNAKSQINSNHDQDNNADHDKRCSGMFLFRQFRFYRLLLISSWSSLASFSPASF